MSLYLRGNIWWCSWQVRGKKIAESTGTVNVQEAQEYHDRRRAELWRESRLDEKPRVTWEEAALAWIEEHACHKRSYDMDLSRLKWLTPLLAGISLDKIGTSAITKLRDKRHKNGVEKSTCNRYLAVVSAILHHAHAKEWVPAVPKIPYFPEPEGRLRFLSADEEKRLLAELPAHTRQMTRLSLATGLRRHNVTHLRWEDVDLPRRTAWVWKGEAKGRKSFAVPLNAAALAVLEEQKGENQEWVFTYEGKPVYHVVTAAWKKALKRAELEDDIDFHTMRHTWASRHVMNGTPLEVLMKLGAWSRLDMVLKYAHLESSYVSGYAENSGANYNSATSPAKTTELSVASA